MKHHLTLGAAALGIIATCALLGTTQAADSSDNDPIKVAMKTYHKAPKGVDPVCKKAVDGQATPAQIKELVAAYKSMAAAKPPKGDQASWKEKTSKLVAAAMALEKGSPGAAEQYKEAVNCKACHSVHKPD